jgi:uncharacterized integral membrane protein
MRSLGLAIYFFFVILLTVIGVVFAKYNADPVVVKFFYMKSTPMAQWIVVFIAFASGFMLSTILLTWKLIRVHISRKKYIKSYEHLKAVLEQKIKDLKTDGHN